ncbi:MAG: alpha/beta hydrolase [Thalassotalea sp.]|nr:alpha/beta hydrolase [Thalassotalea sp.]
MWKSIIGLGMVASSLALTSTSVNAEQEMATAKTGPLQQGECHLDGIREQVTCGTLSVPENYSQPDGQQIDVNFIVLPAIDGSAKKTPLMFLAGGPGQAATELATVLRSRFYEVRKTHDIILVDQRGTGQSSQLKCDETALMQQNVYETLTFDFDLDDVKQCISEFTQDLSQYNSENAIRDFDAVRAALGHDKINVYGGSYGTRAALVYMQLFPESLKSVVLDSVAPMDIRIGLFGQTAARSYQLMLDNCQNEESCHKAFPNLDEDFQKVYAQLSEKPLKLTIPHPRLATPVELKIDVEKFVSTIQQQLYHVQGRSMMPLVIHHAAQGNFMPFVGVLAQGDEHQPKGGIYGNLLMNIACNEDFPLITDAEWQSDADNKFARNISHLGLQNVCPLWPQFQPSDKLYQAVTAEIPTLILSGNLDPVTPPEFGDIADKMLPNSRHIIAEKLAHIVAVNDCGVGLVADFIENLDLADLDDSCLAELPDASFMTSLNGNM